MGAERGPRDAGGCAFLSLSLLWATPSWCPPAVTSDPARQELKAAIGAQRRALELLQVLVLTGVLALVGSRVAALVVLEFSLRAVSALLSLSKVSGAGETEARQGGSRTAPHCLQCPAALRKLCSTLMLCSLHGEDGVEFGRKPCVTLRWCSPLLLCNSHGSCRGWAWPLTASQHPWGGQGMWHGGEHRWLCSGAPSCCFATPMGRMRAAGMGSVGAAARRSPPRAPHPRLLSRLCNLGSS